MKRSMHPRVMLRASPALRVASFVALLASAFRSLSPQELMTLMIATAPLSHTHARSKPCTSQSTAPLSLTHTHVRSQPCTLNAIATRRSPPSSAPSSSLSTLCESHEGKSTCLRARLLRLGGCG